MLLSGSDGEESAYNAGDLGLIPRLGRSPGEGNGISSSVIPFSSCPQPLPASGSFPMSWLFASGSFDTLHQSIGESALASVLPMNIQG